MTVKSVIVKDTKGDLVCYFTRVKLVENIANDYYFKVTLVNGKYFIFDYSSYDYEMLTGKVVKILNEL